MKAWGGSLIPVTIAVLATAGLGAYLNRLNAEIRSSSYRPKPRPRQIEVRIVEQGTVAPWEKLRTEGRFNIAAWIRYESVADGQKRSPTTAGDLLSFYVKDENGNDWPSAPARYQDGNYVLVFGGHPVKPKKLFVKCVYGAKKVGGWELKSIAAPVRRLAKGDMTHGPAKDFPGFEVRPVVRPIADTAFSELMLKQEETTKGAADSLSASLVGHSYGTTGPRGINEAALVLPSFFFDYIDLAEVSVRRSVPREEITVNTEVQGSAVPDENGDMYLAIDSTKRIDIGPASIRIVANPGSGRYGFSVRSRPQNNRVVSKVEVRGIGIDVEKSDEYRNFFSIRLPNAAKPKPIKLELRCSVSEVESKTYVLPITTAQRGVPVSNFDLAEAHRKG